MEWLFNADIRMDRLNKIGNRMACFSKYIDWEAFRPLLNHVRDKENRKPQGRKAYDVVLMFKILILQELYALSDEEAEYRIADSLSFQEFLGIDSDASVPDARTIWLFREQLKVRKLDGKLFELFEHFLRQQGLQATGGQIIDATFVEVPRRRVSLNEPVRQEDTPQTGASAETETKQRTRQQENHIDRDATYMKKRNHSFFGYKNHVNVDKTHKFIRRFTVTRASVHDSLPMLGLMDPTQAELAVWADSAYFGRCREAYLQDQGFTCHINKRGNQHRKLTEEEKATNRENSRIRSRVEHVFGQMFQMRRGIKMIHTIGQARAAIKITLRNLSYNMKRYCILIAQK